MTDATPRRRRRRRRRGDAASADRADGRPVRRDRGEPGPPLHRPRRHQDPSARGPEPAPRGRGADQAHRRRRASTTPARRCRCSRSPRRASTGLWEETREQIREQIRQQGGRVEEREGPLGPELLAEVPVVAGADGTAGKRLARFVGVDGPRWFLRGVIGGAATADVEAAAKVEDLFRSIVVVRGGSPMPPRDLIPLQMPATPGTA